MPEVNDIVTYQNKQYKIIRLPGLEFMPGVNDPVRRLTYKIENLDDSNDIREVSGVNIGIQGGRRRHRKTHRKTHRRHRKTHRRHRK